MVFDWNNPVAGTATMGTPNLFGPPSLMQPTFGTGYGPLGTGMKGSFGAFAPPIGMYGGGGMYGAGWIDPVSSAALYGTGYGITGTGYGFTPFMGSATGYGLTPFANAFAPTLTGTPLGTPFKVGEQLSDQEIENLINDTLDLDPLTCKTDIQVQCQDHVVTLTGTVTSRLVKIAAGNDCWVIPGVRDVDNNIQIKSRSQQGQKQAQRQPVSAGAR
jgi:hypothetical protein